jgi:hypothetical protein
MVITARDSPWTSDEHMHRLLSDDLGVEYYPCRPLAKVRAASEQKTMMMNRIQKSEEPLTRERKVRGFSAPIRRDCLAR